MNRHLSRIRAGIGLSILLTWAIVAPAGAQSNANALPEGPIDLEQAIGIALKNNPAIRQAELQTISASNQVEAAKWQRWPSLSFSASQGFNSGRSIDPYTNQFIQQNVTYNSYGLSAGATLYNGLQISNSIKRNELNKQASLKDLETQRNSVMLNVALGYVQVLNTTELIEVAKSQVEASKFQVDRTRKLVDAGSQAEGSYLDLKAQQANDELALVNAENNYETAVLNLKQLMNVRGSERLTLVPYSAADPAVRAYDASIQEVYEAALKSLPQVQASSLRLLAADKSIDVAKGTRMPSLTIGGGINTNYSSAAPTERFISDGGAPTRVEQLTGAYVKYNDLSAPVYSLVNVPSGSFRHFGYLDQLDFNRNSSVSLSLRVPIFNNFQAKYQIANAKIEKMTVQSQNDQVLLQVRQNVEQAYIDMSNASKRYSATANQVHALQEAFRVAESKFNAGALNSTDYNVAKVNLDKAKTNLVQTKFDYIFRTKVLDFYMGRPLVRE